MRLPVPPIFFVHIINGRPCVFVASSTYHPLGRRLITVRLLRSNNGSNPTDILLPRITFTTTLTSGHTLLRCQFPLAPAYATTFNSCQGLTLDVVGVDLIHAVFAHGQLYTAFSRIRHRSHALIRLPPGQCSTSNVVYDALLSSMEWIKGMVQDEAEYARKHSGSDGPQLRTRTTAVKARNVLSE
ncbi:hypothetical protein NUW54_g2511 [Trametes sanguinea]|uniref:Uncharacterized protein n=1 Tax=Trametes sanguinea TaxID=158606 RepID=A0ACC1Q3C6_9APHY|nr:hypothetical protein NUW54_g2511 [Trametes sanguinea]